MLAFTLSLLFILGYLAIIFEKSTKIDKAATALFMAVVLWLSYFLMANIKEEAISVMTESVYSVAQIIFFLLAVMAIVELIDSHGGFRILTDILLISSKRKMFLLLILLSFFMSAILDNLTSMIVMVSLLKGLIPEKEERWWLGSLIVISVNAGGAWTPIGDVTTTLLWISNKITTWEIMRSLFLPSIVNIAIPAAIALFFIKGERKDIHTKIGHKPIAPGAKTILIMGLLALVAIPFWKAVFGLPPFMGAILGLSFVWIVTDLLHYRHGETRTHLRVPFVLSRIDASSILFFLGILLSIDALAHAGILKDLATFLETAVPNQNYVAIMIGLVSSVVDNIPLVAATIGMYDFPTDDPLWKLIAYAAGTGGSILIIGSAAGIAFMGLEKVDFFWYLKRITILALIGYFAGIGVFFLVN